MRVLITRPREQAYEFAQKLLAMDAEPVFFPTIEVKTVPDTTILDQALTKLECYDWLVLTSVNGVRVLLERMAAVDVKLPKKNTQVAAVGSKTASYLEAHGIPVDFIPEEFVGEAILSGLGDLRGRWMLLPTADIAAPTLAKRIVERGGVAHVVTAYHTLPAEVDPQGLSAIQQGIDVLAFTSGSTVRNFVLLLNQAEMDPFNLPGNPLVACIGPRTASIAGELGFNVDIIADEYTIDGLVTAMKVKLIKEESK